MPKAKSPARTKLSTAVPKKKIHTTNPNNLIAVLKSLGQYSDSEKLAKLADERDKAEECLEEFEKNNPQLRRLRQRSEAASKAYYDQRDREHKHFRTRLHYLRNQVLLHGATPKIVKMVADFAEKYKDNVERNRF